MPYTPQPAIDWLQGITSATSLDLQHPRVQTHLRNVITHLKAFQNHIRESEYTRGAADRRCNDLRATIAEQKSALEAQLRRIGELRAEVESLKGCTAAESSTHETALDWLRSHLPEPGHERTMDANDLRCIRQAIAGLMERDDLLGVLREIEVATDFDAADRDNAAIPGWSDMLPLQQLVAHCGMLSAAVDRIHPADAADQIKTLQARADTNHQIKVELAEQLAEAKDELGRLRIEHEQLRDAYDQTVANVEQHNAYIARVAANAAKRHPPRTPAEALRHCADFFDDHLSNRDDCEADTEVQDRLRHFADQIDQADRAYRDLSTECDRLRSQADAIAVANNIAHERDRAQRKNDQAESS